MNNIRTAHTPNVARPYKRFSTPDSLLGLGSYAMTAGLAAMGGRL